MTISGGDPCIDSGSGGYTNMTTSIFARTPISGDGAIKTWCVHVGPFGGGKAKLKIFRIVGSTMKFVGESALKSLNSGLNTFTNDVYIPVDLGDYIGVYVEENGGQPWVRTTTGSAATVYKKYGDISSDSAVSSWTIFSSVSDIYSLHMGGDASNHIYVKLAGSDANNGSSWAQAKQTINAGIVALIPSGTVHIAFGDYSAQTAITLDKTMYILCENDGGGGTGTVTLPPTT
ncbi:hypothetical protein ANME2D_02313 [Candidatus Methanoperedens nitroreducens]|uniref:DUF1565 domain-containing protein n=2 Tax=Candidatus Methanoperedens nitratireducens TaxID=1392998 RepID=A0A062V4P9_9EURY|nr:hypothetical protein ANME2D_02313 [Candidatus Methanoperedens nitroreducens]MDJ1421206.1 hypothetical protein [Candidatus Methanoperedens sp.]